VMNAMKSQSPVVRAMATQELKGLMTPKTMASHATDASVIASGGNPSLYAAKDPLEAFQPGSLLKDQQGNLRVPNAQPGAAPTVTQLNGDLYHQTPTGLDLINKAPRITTTVNNNTPPGESEFEKTLGRKEATRLSEEIAKRPARIESIGSIKEGLDLLDKGIHTGIFADMQKNLDKGYGALSGKEPEKAARTEQFIAHIGNLVTAGLKLFGGSDTVEEMKYLQKIMAGDITMEPTALKNVLHSLDKKFTARLQETDRAIEAYKGRGKSLPTIDAQVQQPAPSNAQDRVLSPEEYLNQFGK